MIECTNCHGRKTFQCKACRGRGRIGGILGMFRRLCTTCSGAGKVGCSHCRGTGEEPINSLLHDVVKRDNLKEAERLLLMGADPNYIGPEEWCAPIAKVQSKAMAELLLRYKARISDSDSPYERKSSPLVDFIVNTWGHAFMYVEGGKSWRREMSVELSLIPWFVSRGGDVQHALRIAKEASDLWLRKHRDCPRDLDAEEECRQEIVRLLKGGSVEFLS